MGRVERTGRVGRGTTTEEALAVAKLRSTEFRPWLRTHVM